MPRFYEIVEFSYAGGWNLVLIDKTPRGDVTRALTSGEWYVMTQPLEIRISHPGKVMDISVTHMGVPVVSNRAADLLRDIAPEDIQLIPAKVGETKGEFSVLNIVTKLDCVNKENSDVIPVQGPGGGFITTHFYAIDPARVGSHQIFRLSEDRRMIVAEKLKQAIIDSGLIGPGLASMEREPEELMPGIEKIK